MQTHVLPYKIGCRRRALINSEGCDLCCIPSYLRITAMQHKGSNPNTFQTLHLFVQSLKIESDIYSESDTQGIDCVIEILRSFLIAFTYPESS